MNKKNIKNIYSKKNKRFSSTQKILLVLAVCLVFVGIVGKTWAFVDEKIQIKAQEKIQEEERIKAEEEKRKAEEQRKKEEEEKKKYTIGVSHEGQKYTYDAKKIQEKLSKYDYSNDGEKIVFLTFDDGASITVTPEVLRVLKEEDVKATFFVTGRNIERGGDKAKGLIKQEFEEGHAIANHSYSHDYKLLYPERTLNLTSFLDDFSKTDTMLQDILGKYFSTRVLRCPGGHMSWKGMDALDSYLDEHDMAAIDWNALSGDAEGKRKNAQELTEYAIRTSQGKEIVVLLMHDTYGKEETVKALPQIIKHFKDNGYAFKTLS